MTETSVSLADNLNANLRSHDRAAVAQVSERWLVAARAVWISLFILTVGLLVAAIPLRYGQYSEICSGEACEYLQLSPVEADALQTIGFSPDSYALYAGTLEVITAFIFVAVGLLIFWRKSQEWIALLVSLWLITFGTSSVLIAVKAQHPIWHHVAGYLDELGWVFLLQLFLFLFPDGRFVPCWTRWLIVAVAGLMIFLAIFQPEQTDPANPTPVAGQIVWFSIQLIGIGAQVSRYRRVSDPVQRQQTKWVVFGLVAVALLIMSVVVLSQIDLPLRQPGLAEVLDKLIEMTLVTVALLIIPLSISISILHYRLWDIDIIISRTLVYGLLTALVVGIYVLVVGMLGALLQSGGSLLISLTATGTVAVLFQPLRERLQRGVNRLMFGQRDEPYQIFSRLGQQLNTVTASESLLPTIVETVAAALKLPYTAITIRQHDQYVMHASHGDAKTPTHIVPLVYQNEQVGQLVVGQRSPGEPLTPADQRILEDIARQMGAVVHAVRLTDDLQRSRERLVTAREEERRRLRRDLHDGLGPALASHTLKLDAAIDLVETTPKVAIKLLCEVKTQSQALVADVRWLVYDLRPPALDELGLLAALRSHISQLVPHQSDLTITIETPGELPPLSAAVEVAVYRIAQEAVLNVIKHAGARRCILRLSILSDDPCLQIEVIDDGIGLPQPVSSGVGLQSMRERAEELGGQYVARNWPSGGTQIQVRLPLLPVEVTA